ncbi:Flocculation suppression protein [Coemansia sp. RSA 486]|nr:Flocculation suppression protein [Coemansia sp. RSA 486]
MTTCKSVCDALEAQDAEHNMLDTPLSSVTETETTTASSSVCTPVSGTASALPTKAAATAATAATDAAGIEQSLKPRLLIQKTHAAFVSKLYAMVSDTSTDSLISWTSEGDCFKVTDPMEFSRNVLPAYFKHGNWQSFVRQLNMYGFHKISDLAYGGIFGDMQLWMFKHPSFQRGELKMLQHVKRRGPKAASGQNQNLASSDSPADASVCASSTQVTPSGKADEQVDSGAHAQSIAEDRSDCDASASISVQASSAVFSPCPLNWTTDAAPVSDSPAQQHMRGYVEDLKSCIQDLQQSNSQLHQENQKMRATIANCQNAFAGIMSFLETAIVKPSTQVAEQPATPSLSVASVHRGQHIVDAFSKLVGDVAPVVSDLGCMASSHFQASINNCVSTTSASISLAPFRTVPPKLNDCEVLGNRHTSQAQHSWRHEHGYEHGYEHERQTLPPIRPGPGAQPSEGPRIPSLSPPAGISNKRRSSSSSSSGSSSCNNSEAGDADAQPLTPYIVLPPISGMVDSASKHKALQQPHEDDIRLGLKSYMYNVNNPSGYWQVPRQQSSVLSLPHESSLRETLPQKRPRFE